MKRNRLLHLLFGAMLAAIFAGCSNWTDPEAKDFFEYPSDNYYESLRAYKNSKHQVAFGWYGNWTGTGASLANSLLGIPDSIDIVSFWDGAGNMTPEKKEELDYCQKVKGTKFVLCSLLSNIGDGVTPAEFNDDSYKEWEYWGLVNGDEKTYEDAIRRYANALCDTIDARRFDGYDIDFEPAWAKPRNNLVSNSGRMIVFINELSRRLGPKSGTGKLLIIDGELWKVPAETGPCFDYLVSQTYKPTSDPKVDERLVGEGFWKDRGYIPQFEGYLTEEEVVNKLILTETFESVFDALNGGFKYKDRYGNEMMSLEGLARYQPTSGYKKAGFGCYHMEAEYPTTPVEYRWMRNAIQAANPSLNTLIKK